MSDLFGKVEIVNKIGKKINNTIQIRLLNDIVDLIDNFICDEIIANKTFSVNKFGTFYQATRKPRLVWSRAQQQQVMSRPGIEIRFAPHTVFSKLLKEKRKVVASVLKSEISNRDKKKSSGHLT